LDVLDDGIAVAPVPRGTDPSAVVGARTLPDGATQVRVVLNGKTEDVPLQR